MNSALKTPGTLLLLFTLSACHTSGTDINLISDGVSSELAEFRKGQIDNVTYDLTFDIPALKQDPIASELQLTLNLHDLSHPLLLDFKESPESLLSLSVNDKEVPIHYEKEHLVVPVAHHNKGPISIHIKFIAGDLSLNRNDDYLYTLLVPDRARTLFPCFDQPDIKARYRLHISVPESWQVLCGAAPESIQKSGNRAGYQFAESDKMSTYLFSFVAGRFDEAKEQRASAPMKMLYRETNEEKIKASTDTIFGLHKHALAFLGEFTGIPYPFKKFDFAAIPGFQYGGMEHVGAIQYNESSLFLDSSATQSQELGRAKLIAHETAHMWFGDLVTMKWFDDVWLKEVFANVMADKIINPAFPETNHALQFMLAHHTRAYNVDRTPGSNPIRQALGNLADAGSLYGNIIYHKAPIMMRQLETILGEDAFREGLRQYLKEYAYDNAGWPQLISIFDTASALDINQWSEVWVNSTGRPVISGEIKYSDDANIDSFIVSQQAEDGSNKIWPQVFEVQFVYSDSVATFSLPLYKNSYVHDKIQGWPIPNAIIYNSNGYGYGVFPVPESMNNIIPGLEDTVARGYSYVNCYENALNGLLSPGEALALCQKGLLSENNELILGYLADVSSQLYWMYLSDEERPAFQEGLLALLMKRLMGNAPPNIKKTLFGLFKSVATSEKGRQQLYEIWKKELQIPGLQLNEDDYTSLAMQLALYNHPEISSILESARKAISNPDKIRRFDFLQPALSANALVRADFFESFRKQENREKESWVLSACYYIHHPIRQKSAVTYLPMSLELLPEIAATGDIFFPKGWLDNTIGQYNSPQAYAILQDYLSGALNLNPFLKSKLLQATDDIYRVQQIKKGPQHPD